MPKYDEPPAKLFEITGDDVALLHDADPPAKIGHPLTGWRPYENWAKSLGGI